jgi:hypothetical protein
LLHTRNNQARVWHLPISAVRALSQAGWLVSNV